MKQMQHHKKKMQAKQDGEKQLRHNNEIYLTQRLPFRES